MPKRLLAVALVALLCVLAWLGLRGVAASGATAGKVVLIVSAATLLVSVAAAVASLIALARTSALQARLRHLAASVDAALHDVMEQRNRDVATLSKLDARLARQSSRLAANVPISKTVDESTVDAKAEQPMQGNVVPHPATMRVRPNDRQPVPPDRAAASGLAAALQRAVTTGALELSLQPIISISAGAAIGFEAFAHLQPEDGESIDIRRMADPAPGLSAAAFERLLVTAATEAARRRLGAASDAMPFHIAVSEALLTDGDEVDRILAVLASYPVLTRSIVLSLPAGLIATPGSHSQALDRFASTGLRLAGEGWPETGKDAEAFRRNAVSFIKLSADLLLGRTATDDGDPDAVAMLEMAAAAGMTVIATDVRNDDDAIGLIDLGISLMTGERFSSPRRLKPDGDDSAERIVRL